ncbi:PepSY-like domain-containing protein [Bacteroides stercorirosoris]|uniref:Putative beta-lactamase-inhibitor-like, PepSY-like n=1 Tax=Bacteroides stercorirosoris TaxID=871324 RepID=A0A1M6GKP9_9BACE|nr:PepSY-like domain-containing protein [Bacteroides stercorirosoris]SHJ10493.1 Putative beta-lactamase-inhibitor-like, PepSY-like [Bacteroides stercorirosoris]
MKLKMYFALLTMGMIGLQSCSNDDDDDLPSSKVPEAVRNAFDSSFSNTANLSWETKTVSKGQYYKAEFNNKSDNGYKTEAWYTADGTWYMTETEMPYNAIPQAVKTSFESSEYASWKRDNEVDRIERNAVKEIIYIIEVESPQDVDMDLHYSADGILVKAVNDDGDGDNESLLPDTPSEMVTTATEFIQKNYPNARIIEIETEHGVIEIDIIHDNRSKEVLLGTTYEWISTSWDVYTLPAKVTEAINASQYNGHVVDDAEYFETPAGNYYLVELEQGKNEVKIKITEEGEIV